MSKEFKRVRNFLFTAATAVAQSGSPRADSAFLRGTREDVPPALKYLGEKKDRKKDKRRERQKERERERERKEEGKKGSKKARKQESKKARKKRKEERMKGRKNETKKK